MADELSLGQASEMTGVPRTSLRRMLQRGAFPGAYLEPVDWEGRQRPWRIPVTDLVAAGTISAEDAADALARQARGLPLDEYKAADLEAEADERELWQRAELADELEAQVAELLMRVDRAEAGVAERDRKLADLTAERERETAARHEAERRADQGKHAAELENAKRDAAEREAAALRESLDLVLANLADLRTVVARLENRPRRRVLEVEASATSDAAPVPDPTPVAGENEPQARRRRWGRKR